MLIRVTTEISFKSTDECKEMLKFEAENDMTEWHKKKSTVYTTFWKEENWMADMRGESMSKQYYVTGRTFEPTLFKDEKSAVMFVNKMKDAMIKYDGYIAVIEVDGDKEKVVYEP